MQADRIEAENQLSTLSDRCHDREEMVRRAQRAATEIQMRAETVETELRKTVQQTSTELQRRIAQLEVSSLPCHAATRPVSSSFISPFSTALSSCYYSHSNHLLESPVSFAGVGVVCTCAGGAGGGEERAQGGGVPVAADRRGPHHRRGGGARTTRYHSAPLHPPVLAYPAPS